MSSRLDLPSTDAPQTVAEWVRWGGKRLHHLDHAELESRALMGAMLGSSTAVWTKAFEPLSPTMEDTFKEWVERRACWEPLHLIVGEVPFFGRTFRVRPGVLIPRPETEHLVGLAIDHLKNREDQDIPTRILDLGSGSGIIALTVLLECPHATGIAIERDPKAFKVLIENRERFSMKERLSVVLGSWEAVSGHSPGFDCILSNPPYIPSGAIATLEREVRDFEPRTALDGGRDGLSCYRDILSFAPSLLKNGGLLAFEIGADQASAFLSDKSGKGDVHPPGGLTGRPSVLQDVSGRDRVIFWKK